MPKIKSFIWNILLILVFLRPFLSEYAFLYTGFWYIFIFIFFLSIYLSFFVDKRFLFSSPLNFAVLLFIFTISISIIFSGFTHWSLFELYLFIPNIFIFYIVGRIKSEQQKQLIITMFISASIISIYAIYQYLIGFKHTLEYIRNTMPNVYAEEILNRKRAFATFVSPNIFASYITMMLFVGMGFLISVPRREKLIYGICLPIMIISLILTKSLGGILVFLIIFSLFIFYILPTLGLKRTILKKMGLTIAFVSVALLIIFGIFIRHRIIPEFLSLNDPNNSIIQRLYYWKTSLDMIKDHPLIGVGWRKFGFLYRFLYNRCYNPYTATISHYSHNVFLQIMAEMGLLGLLSFLWIVFIFLKKGLRNIKNSNEPQGLKIGPFFGGCAFLLYNLIDLSFYFGQVSFFWWIILALFA